MLEKGKITPRQTGELLFIIMLASAVFLVPNFAADKVAQDAWLALLLGALLGFVPLWIVTRLGEHHPGKTIFQYSETVLGKWPGKLLTLYYVWSFLRVTAIVFREFSEFLVTSFMPNTPPSVFVISLAFMTVWAVLAGLEVIARMNEFIILLVCTALVIVILLSLNNWDLNLLLPPFQANPLTLLKTAVIPNVWRVETVTVAILMPFMTRPKKAFVSGAAAACFAGVALAMGVIAATAVFSHHLLATLQFPIYNFVRTIKIAQFLSRFEVLVIVVWVAGIFIKTSIYLYLASLGLAQAAGLREYRPVVLPLAVICIAWAFSLYENIIALAKAVANASINIFILYLLLPLLLLLVTLVRENIAGRRQTGEKND